MSIHRRARLHAWLLLSALLASLAGCGPRDPVAAVRDLQAEGRYAESLEPLRALIETRPDDPEVQYLYGHALLATRQVSLAQFSLRKAMESPEWVVPAGLELASAGVLTDSHDEAIEAATRVLEVEPDHLDALLLRARALATSRQRYQEALADADRVIALDPGNVEGLVLRAVSLLGLERVADAEAAIAELDGTAQEADLAPAEAARFCGMRALFAKEKGDPQGAEQLFSKCLEANPAEMILVEQAVKFFDEQRQPERSEEVLRAALVEAPTAGVFRRSLAERLRLRGEAAEAERILREATEMENPALAAEAWVDLASYHYALGDYSTAASAMQKAVEIDGGEDSRLVFDCADALVMAQRYDEALEIARAMNVPAHRELIEGRVALDQGRPAEALDHFGEALRLWPNNAVARYYAALAAEETGDFDRAIAEYRYSIRADPNVTDARLRLARLHEAEGAGDLALAVVRHDSGRNPAGPEAELLAVRVGAQLGRMPEVQPRLAQMAGWRGALGPGIAAAAEGTRARQGPAAAAELVRTAKLIDLTDPKDAAALRALVENLVAAGDAAGALAAAKAALAKHPDAAAFHSIHGLALAGSGAPAEQVRAAYSRAVELDPERSAEAFAALGEIAAAAGDSDAALAAWARAAETDPDETSALAAAAELLLALDRADEALAQLEQALDRRPYEARIAARLAALLLERGGQPERAVALAKRAVRFGGGPAAQELLAQAQQGLPELARQGQPAAGAAPESR